MSTKKKKRAPRTSLARLELAELGAELTAKLETIGRNIGELESRLVAALRTMREESSSRRVFVLLIGEYLQRDPGRFVRRDESGDEDATPEWARPIPFVRKPAEPKIVRGFLSATSEPIRHDDGWHRAAVRLDDPGQRLWAPGAWLIAFNAGVLSNVKIGDLAQGNGVDSPIVQLSHAIQPGQLVQATVRLDTFTEPRR